jgi:imidazoleglycerol phosphate synthase glutamine amidotransferase subunit HisH
MILGYNSTETEYLNNILEDNNIKYKYSLLESEITKAEKIILPHPINFYSTHRKMNMMNLFSLLRLFKKPILGINGGFYLMCNKFLDSTKCGLGFFHLDVNTGTEMSDPNRFVRGKIRVLGDSNIIRTNLNDRSLNFNSKIQTFVNVYSKALIFYAESNYSFICEHENYYGIEIDFEKNKNIGQAIIENFLRL